MSKADREALEQGADLNQVVNSRRGRQMRGQSETTTRLVNGEERVVNVRHQVVVDGMTTTEGSTRRRGQPVRLTPAGIYRQAGDDRDAALALLQANGYLVT